jgi:hypothetical protein
MRRLHFSVGLAAVAVFLITGQFIRHHTPPMSELGAAARLLYRSRHIYILAGGLVNLMLGLYMQPQSAGWRERVQRISSGLVLLSPAILTAAFTLEPARGFHSEMLWSSAGLYALFGGCMGHWVSASALERSGAARADAATSN